MEDLAANAFWEGQAMAEALPRAKKYFFFKMVPAAQAPWVYIGMLGVGFRSEVRGLRRPEDAGAAAEGLPDEAQPPGRGVGGRHGAARQPAPEPLRRRGDLRNGAWR